jgi:hypothetical protein
MEVAKKTTVTPAVQRQSATFSVAPVSRTSRVTLQPSLKVSSPSDSSEVEAVNVAKRIMRAPVSDNSVHYSQSGAGKIFRLQNNLQREKIQRKGTGVPAVSPELQSKIQGSSSEGSPLPSGVKSFMEPRFKADFSNVKVHTSEKSARMNAQLSAKAFTVGNNIFFGKDQFRPEHDEGKELIAHELTHTIQQGAAIQRREDISVTQTSATQVQRLGLSDALNFFADKANYIPGFRMFTVILGMNPINMAKVDRSAANILRAVIELLPGGALITQALDNHGIIEKVAAWIEQQINTLGMVGSSFKQAITDFLGTLSWSDIFDFDGIWARAKRILTEPIDRIINFGKGLITGIIKFVKDAILKPLAKLAEGAARYDLLKAVLGQDPVTGEPVPQTADTIIGGFMKMIGQEEVWENIKKGNAIARAWAWFQGALAGLMGFVRSIPKKIVDTITSLTITDIVTIVGAFSKIASAFVSIVVNFTKWAIDQVLSLLEILVSVVAPGVMPYIKKAQFAFHTIIKKPVAFVGNLVRAGKLGFEKFASNIGQHLKTALIKWLTGPLGDAGVYIPKSFSLMEIIKLVLSVLGLTWQNIRSKLVKIIPEPVLVVLEKTAGILVTLVKDGPAAAWEQIKTELTELKDQLIAQVTQMVTSEIVKAAVIKLVSMLNPAGAIIQAIIAIYNTVTFFIQKIQQIAAVVASFIDSIAEIASGMVENAAKKVEQTMANTLTIIIAFLAKFVGLGNVPEKLVAVIKKIRQPIDKGMDKIVGWLGGVLKKLMGKDKPDERTEIQKQTDLNQAIERGNEVLKNSQLTLPQIKSQLAKIKSTFRLTSFDIIYGLKDKKTERDRLKAVINPVKEGVEIVRDLEDGGFLIVITSRLGPRKRRKATERRQPSAREYGGKVDPTMERAHAAGAGLGHEFEEAIRLAPRYVNQTLQNRGIEKFFRALVKKVQGDPNIALSQKLIVKTYTGTLRLQQITYRLMAEMNGKSRVVLEATIDISNDPQAAEAHGSISYVNSEFLPWLTSVAEEVFEKRLDRMGL